MQMSEEERLYEAESRFLANLEYWRNIHEKGVEVYPRNSICTGPLPDSVLAEQLRQQEIARLLEYIKAGELTLREAANTIDGLILL